MRVLGFICVAVMNDVKDGEIKAQGKVIDTITEDQETASLKATSRQRRSTAGVKPLLSYP
jgi:hypothetical protein